MSSASESSEGTGHPRALGIAAAVSGVVIDEQLGSRPGTSEFPRGIDRAAQVQAAMDKDAGNARQTPGVTNHRVVSKPSGVGIVMRADPDERQHIIIRRLTAGGQF